MKTWLALGAGVVVAVLGGVSGMPEARTSTAELLEQAIYTEETVGDLKEAVAMYQRVIDEADAARPYVARAHFRQGLCYLKLGQEAAARAAWSRLTASFPEQQDLVTEANRHMQDLGVTLDPTQIRDRVKTAVQTISTCREGDPRVTSALATLRGIDGEVVSEALASYLDSKQATVRRAAVYILWQGDIDDIEPAVPALSSLCTHAEDLTRGMAALALGGKKVQKAFDALREMTLADDSGYARRCAAYALGLLGNPAARPVLQQALQDPDSLVVNNARTALAMLPETGAEDEQTNSRPAEKPSYTQTHHVTLSADGSGLHASTSRHVNRSQQPLLTYSFVNSINNIEMVQDEDGQELAFEVARRNGHYVYEVTRTNPVPPGETYESKVTVRGDRLAIPQGDLWVYQRDHTPIPETDYRETVQLPPGAKLVSVEPEPTSQTVSDGAVTLRFERVLRRNEAFRCRITYRLPLPASRPPDAPAGNPVQLLIDAAQPGGVVHVPRGVYSEPITIDKALTLKGVDAEACIFEYAGRGVPVRIQSAEPVRIEALTFQWQLPAERGAGSGIGVFVEDGEVTLHGCRFETPENRFGYANAIMAHGTSHLTIRDCRLHGFHAAVDVAKNAHAVIEDSQFLSATSSGLSISTAGTVEIRNNLFAGSAEDGISFVLSSGDLLVEGNLFVRNRRYALFMGLPADGTGVIRNNILWENHGGMRAFGGGSLEIANNLILDSTEAGLHCWRGSPTTVHRNILSGNAVSLDLSGPLREGQTARIALGQNTLWGNDIDTDVLAWAAKSLQLDPRFAAPERGDFAVGDPGLRNAGQGLEDPTPLQALWRDWLTVAGEL